jgi:uroporphyrinogen decarboxylase
MNSRERVLRAVLRHGLPDRVPLQFDLCRDLLEKFSQKYSVPVYYTTSWFEDVTYRISGNELRMAMGSDCVIVGASLPRNYTHSLDNDGCITNEFGMKMRQGPLYMELLGNPLAYVADTKDVEDFPFPDPLADGRYDDAMRYIERYKGEYFIVGDIELTIFALARHLVGMEKLLADMALSAPYVEHLLDKCMNFMLAMGKRLVDLGVDGIWAGDDFGGQNGMLISPKMWRRYFKERYRHLYAELKAVNPQVVIMQHSDGAIAPILGDWIEVGMQVFNPVQPGVPGHDPEELKRRFGDRLSFWGAIDQQNLLPFGSLAEIEADVKSKIEVLGRGGGYMIAPAHIIQADTPMENVEAFIGAVKRYGRY